MRAAGLSWRAPPSPIKTSTSSTAIIALQLRASYHSVPPKESKPAYKNVRGCLPQSFHSPQFSEPDPIYPYLPFLFFWTLFWQRPCHGPLFGVISFRYSFFFGNLNRDPAISAWRDFAAVADSYIFDTGPSVQSDDYRSLASTSRPGSCSGKIGNQVIDFCHCIVKMGSNTQTVSAWCCHNVSILETGIERHWAKITTVSDTNYLRLLTRQS